jgi:hypothetical protein
MGKDILKLFQSNRILSCLEKQIVLAEILFIGQEIVVVQQEDILSIGNAIIHLDCHLFNVVDKLDFVELV